MKRLKYLLSIALLLAWSLLPVLPVKAETNLIANPSVETASAGNPANWTANAWGTNTATPSYESTGHTGTKSLRFNVASYTSGDAKWMHDAVAVSPNTSYTYTSFYKSTVGTEIDLQYTATGGAVSYAYVQFVPAAADWTQLTATFTTPANAASVRVMHVIAANGSLQTDDFSLSTTVVAPPPGGDNLIANPSFETANGATPAGWSSNSWGTNTANFVYENTGRTGSRSATAALSTYTSGDAKWFATPVNVTAGNNYSYSDYYKSGVTTRLVAAYQNAAGTASYQELGTAPANAAWTQRQVNFTVPAGITKVSIYHVIESVGSLTIDDVNLTGVTTPPPTGDNLIANPSFETANGANPASWQNNKWGTNTANFTYENTGRTGSKSVKTTVTAYTDGDAKWFFSPVNVTAGTTYTYRDYFKSNVSTRVVVAFVNGGGVYTYAEQTGADAATDWTLYQTQFTVPAGTVQTTVYHLIDRVGSLTIDDAELKTQTTTPPGGTNVPIPNSSLEQGSGGSPVSWSSNKWGTNGATFQYVTTEGHTGNRSVKVTMSNHTSGDAKWMFDPLEDLNPGSQYRAKAWYKGTVIPKAVAVFIMGNGSEVYFGMPNPQTVSSTQWQEYDDTFTVPQGAVQAGFFLFIDANGWIQTDDYSLQTYSPTGFNRALVTLTFDDGWEVNAQNALPVMEQHGFKSTQCYATQFVEGQPQSLINSNLLAFHNAGHEICSHSVTHPFMTTLNSSDLNFEAQHSQEYLESLVGVPVRNFATPFGDYNNTVVDVLDNYYQSHRSVDEGFNSKDNLDVYRLRVQNILSTTTAAQVTQWVNQAIADKTWLILVYHMIAEDPGEFDTDPTVFTEHMQAIDDSNVTVKTWQAALDEVLPQL